MSDSFQVSISLNVANEDGTPFCANTLEYESVPYEALLKIEQEMIVLLTNLLALGSAPAPAANGKKA